MVSMATKTGHKVEEAAEFKPPVLSTTLERETTFSTQLKLIEIPSREFFPMWQSHMDSLLQRGLDYTTGSVWEFVLADCRLQYIDLLKLDGAVEVEFFSFDEDDTFLAVPCECCEEMTWKVNSLGWVKIPTYLNQEAHRIALSNEWWIGLRTSFNASIRSLMQYKLFANRFLRLFIVPVRGEDCMRVIVTSNTPEVLKSFSKSLNDVGARLLACCLISKPPGEFPATLQDVTDGTQETHETEVCEYLNTGDQSPLSESQPISKHLIHCNHTSSCSGRCLETATTGKQLEAKPGSSSVPYSEPPLCDSVMVSVEDGSDSNAMDAAASVPRLSTVQLTTRSEDDALPSAPTLTSADFQKGVPTSTIGQALDAAFAPTENTTNEPVSKPLPVLVRQPSIPDANADFGLHLFPHQKRTVSWMLDIEAGEAEPLFVPQATVFESWYAFSHGFEKSVFHDTVDVMVPHNHRLARGGLVAHPVGSGKTVIAAELINQTLGSGLTLIFVPDHITRQWERELKRFVPGISTTVVKDMVGKTPLEFWLRKNPTANAIIVPHSLVPRLKLSGVLPFRIIIDEPQDTISKSGVYEALLIMGCPRRWLLTATPTPLATMMQLTLGYEETPLCKLRHGSMLSWFVRTRCRRDPPYLCLPVPPLHIHMRPVTLLWQETSVLHSFTMRGDLQSAIRLASFFYFTREQIRRGQADEALPGAKTFRSLDEWVTNHRGKLLTQLQQEERALQRAEERISQEKAAFAEKQSRLDTQEKHVQATTPTAVSSHDGEDASEDVINLEQVFEERDESGVSLGLLRTSLSHRQNIGNIERLLNFLTTISDTVTSDTDCLICMNQLGGRVVSMLPCLHSFCAACAAWLFANSSKSPCPVCRESANRREICTFMCNATQLPTFEDFREKYGSKICLVIQEIIRIHKEFPNDKILVFGQWHDLLRQMKAAMPREVQHCFLDGPLSQRCETIERFRTDSDLRVMLLSSESQSSGIYHSLNSQV